MGRIHQARRSWVITIGALVLIAAAAGTAVAGPTATPAGKADKALKKANKALKIAKKTKKKEGPAGPAGVAGAAGTARAYGHVAADGTLTNSKNVASVTNPSTGSYCIEPAAQAGIADTTKHPIVVTPDFFNTSTSVVTDELAHFEVQQGNTSCIGSETTEFGVEAFVVDLDGSNLAFANQGFNFVIP
ncbi:MAG: hypothetical protein ACR2N5_08695 [Solirubrobacterales bacterium]